VSGEVSQSITRKSASNLALAFILLPAPKRAGMASLYAFCREVDDAADDETQPAAARRKLLEEWRTDIRVACQGGAPRFAVNQELAPVISEYQLPFEHFDELIRGVEMDLDIRRYATYEDLEHYCYRVASVVGLLSIRIFGHQNPRCTDYAVHLGKALQLTNILRDVRNDAERGRIYLPTQELARHGVREEEILRYEYSERFAALGQAVAARARYHYQQARLLLPQEDRRAMACAELMGMVYWRLLGKLEARQFDVLGPLPTRVSRWHKLLLIARAWFQLNTGSFASSYGGS